MNGYYPDILTQYKHPPQQNSFLWVQGEAAAKSFLVAPGQTVLLMDSEGSRFYLKSADPSGVPSTRVFEYKEVIPEAPPPPIDPEKYVTWERLEERLSQLTPAKKTKKETTDDE